MEDHLNHYQSRKTPTQRKLSRSKIYKYAFSIIIFLGTLNMERLNWKHEPRLRRSAFLEWIMQLGFHFSSDQCTQNILHGYSPKKRKIIMPQKTKTWTNRPELAHRYILLMSPLKEL